MGDNKKRDMKILQWITDEIIFIFMDITDFVSIYIFYPIWDFLCGKRFSNGKWLVRESMLLMIAVPLIMHFACDISWIWSLLGGVLGASFIFFCNIPFIGPGIILVLCGFFTWLSYEMIFCDIYPKLQEALNITVNRQWIDILYYIVVFLIILRLHIGDGN